MPLNGVGYYQLKQIDTDGKISKSFIRSISSKAELDLVISPNPVQSKFTITSNLSNLESVRIVNTNGTTVFQHKLKVNEKTIDISKLPAASYVVILTDTNGETISKHIVKQ